MPLSSSPPSPHSRPVPKKSNFMPVGPVVSTVAGEHLQLESMQTRVEIYIESALVTIEGIWNCHPNKVS